MAGFCGYYCLFLSLVGCVVYGYFSLLAWSNPRYLNIQGETKEVYDDHVTNAKWSLLISSGIQFCIAVIQYIKLFLVKPKLTHTENTTTGEIELQSSSNAYLVEDLEKDDNSVIKENKPMDEQNM